MKKSTVIVLSALTGCLVIAAAAYVVAEVTTGVSAVPEATSGSADPPPPWFVGAGHDGAVVVMVSPQQGQGLLMRGWTQKGATSWTAAQVSDGAAVRPPAATIMTTLSERRSRVWVIDDHGRKERVEDVDSSTVFRALGVHDRLGWYALVSSRDAVMKCVDMNGELISSVSLGQLLDIVSAGASADGRRFALLASPAENKYELLWLTCGAEGHLTLIRRCSASGSFMALSSDGASAVVADGLDHSTALQFGASRGVSVDTGFLSEGAIGAGRILAVTRQADVADVKTSARIIDVASGKDLWTMQKPGQWMLHADPELRYLAVTDPHSRKCSVIDLETGSERPIDGDCVDAWPLAAGLVATLDENGRVAWRANPFTK